MISTSDQDRAARPELEGPIVATMELAAYLCVTRQTILRWRLVGYLPKPVRCDPCGTFWMKSTIDAWEACGRPWADPVLARKSLAKHGSAERLNEFIAPEGDLMEVRSTAAIALLDDFERQLNALDFLVQGDAGDFDLAALGERFSDVRKELKAARGRLSRRNRRRRT